MARMTPVDTDDPLKARLLAAISPHAPLYDALWRQDRLFRYAAWLQDGQARPSRFPSAVWLRGLQSPVDSPAMITRAALESECQLWETWSLAAVSDVDALDAAARTAEDQMRRDRAEAVRMVSDPALIARGLPVWNADACCLLPARLGSWELHALADNEDDAPGLGVTYRYEHTLRLGRTSLYLFTNGCDAVRPGIADARSRATFGAALQDAAQFAHEQSHVWEWIERCVVETTPSSNGNSVEWFGAAWRIERSGKAPLFEALSLTGFRERFLKVRCSILADIMGSDAGTELVDTLNTALADWVVDEGP
jgi:hypothetical protein